MNTSSKILLSFIVVIISIAYARLRDVGLEDKDMVQFYFCAIVSIIGYIASSKLIPKVKITFIERGNLWGYDINKGGKEHGEKV